MDPERARELLALERARLQRALAELGAPADAGEPDPEDQGDAASGLVEAELEGGIAAGLREELAAVGRAERRVDDGTYGLSVESGAAIPDGRLEAIPWAERTAEEQARLDSRRR